MTRLLLLKFGKREYINSLYKKGHIYINLLSELQKGSGNDQRFDFLEGAISNFPLPDGILQFRESKGGPWKKLEAINTRLNDRVNTSEFYCYSLFAVTREDVQQAGLYKIDQKMMEFGESFLMINNHVTFLAKIRAFLDSNGFKYIMGSVVYLDYTRAHKDLTLFNKTDTLNHQKEFRILIKAKSSQPLQFEIGTLENDSTILESQTVETLTLKL